ncbi:MAG: hypothetical protein GXP25_00420 [Planctomycetes bacterium]|nr:hypothetical protein [Planctomycetota bacterium]
MSSVSFANQQKAEQHLDSFDLQERMATLEWLSAQGIARAQNSPERINMHFHSFFSYNSMGYSPCHIAWRAHCEGLYATALCDFDVLNGMEEYFAASEVLGIRAAMHVETRVFIPEYADAVMNSPGEPGAAYYMGAGFVRMPPEGSSQAEGAAHLRQLAQERNIALVDRINAKLPQIAIDYEREVVPLSPGRCPTERHIVQAYRVKAESAFDTPAELHDFWAKVMGKAVAEVAKLAADVPSMEGDIRAALVKSGGIGYEQPTEKTFPRVDDFIQWVLDCEAIPMYAWLDGTNDGEEDIRTLLECVQAKGSCALNIIPDRNHRIDDPDVRAKKLAKLKDVVRVAGEMHLPINIGTEMNKLGQPFSDDIGCEALRPYYEPFMRGARIMVGHTLLSRFAEFSYVGRKAEAEFSGDTPKKNDAFEAVGALPPLTRDIAKRLQDMGPDKAHTTLRDSAVKGEWTV